MNRPHLNEKGVVLYLVLGILLVVVVLANVILAIISSQSRLTHHQVSRIQAYYATQAAMNLTFENLRTGVWATGSYTLCNSGCTVNDPDIPFRVSINISDPAANGVRTINLTSNYTYTP